MSAGVLIKTRAHFWLTRPVMLQVLQSGRFALEAERILIFNGV